MINADKFDTVNFGNYEWLQLTACDGRALLITKDIIDFGFYDSRMENWDSGITWEHCELREYLNGEFYNSFREHERARIMRTMIKNDDNPYLEHFEKKLWFNSENGMSPFGGNDTLDSIFLLSIQEAVDFFGSDRLSVFGGNVDISDEYNEVRKAKASDKLLCRNDYWGEYRHRTGRFFEWMLRSPGRSSNFAAVVSKDGVINIAGLRVIIDDDDIAALGIRPALWLEL
jgi:hypothetical protein